MGFPGMPDPMNDAMRYVPPDPLGVYEHNLGDEWRAVWTPEGDLPAGDSVLKTFVLLYMEGKGYVVRPAADDIWSTIEGEPNAGEKFDATVKRLCKEQAAAEVKSSFVTGYLDCKATSHNPKAKAGERAVVPFVVVEAKTVKELGKTAPFQRRRLPANEHAVAIRKRYPEWERYFGDSINTYLIRHTRGEI